MVTTTANRLLIVKDRIETVCAVEAHHENLRRFLSGRLPHLHYAISATRQTTTLYEFVLRYIHQAPEFLDILYKIARDNGFLADVEPLIAIATDFFLSPPASIPEANTILGLIDEAYLTHRLLEEINDQLMLRTGSPLLPMDTTTANLIMHDIIGETFGNELDSAAIHASDAIFQQASFGSEALASFAKEHAKIGWEYERARWPSLAENLGLTLTFTSSHRHLQ